MFTVGGVRVAHLAYTRSWNTDLPRDRWMLASVTTPEQVAADVATVRSAGAEIVIVSLHLGTEMQTGPTGADRTFATTLTSIADVDLVVHHGPHVVQPVERVNGTLVYWSVGNLVSGMGTAGSGKYADLRTLDGLLATVRFTESQPGRFVAESWPVVVCTSRLDRSVHPAVSELADPELAALGWHRCRATNCAPASIARWPWWARCADARLRTCDCSPPTSTARSSAPAVPSPRGSSLPCRQPATPAGTWCSPPGARRTWSSCSCPSSARSPPTA